MNTRKYQIAFLAISFTLVSGASLPASSVQAQGSTAPSLEVATPSEGQTLYVQKVPVLLFIENLEIVDYSQNAKPIAGQGHIHLWIDDQNPTPQSATKVTSDTHTFDNVPYGEHTLRAELVTNDHKSLNPPQVVTINFKTEAPQASSPAVNSGVDKKSAAIIFVVVALVIVAAWWYTKEEDEDEQLLKKARKPKKTSKAKTSARKKRK